MRVIFFAAAYLLVWLGGARRHLQKPRRQYCVYDDTIWEVCPAPPNSPKDAITIKAVFHAPDCAPVEEQSWYVMRSMVKMIDLNEAKQWYQSAIDRINHELRNPRHR